MRYQVTITVSRKIMWGCEVEADDEFVAKGKAIEALENGDGWTLEGESDWLPDGIMTMAVEPVPSID